ncbi:zinc-binding dehydrogenase [Streptomyces lincolnensis]|uniref:zinc-binding dehydrogenase n=1 Tax=Streptomyces lincolnensis TaxID=1915 RepID=UPI0037D4D3B2
MRAVVATAFGGPEVVEVVQVGVREGVFGGAGEWIGLGWDVAGTVDAVGDGAAGSAWGVGDAVVVLAPGLVRPLGSHAEYVLVDAGAVAAAPRTADVVHAATLPLNALTAAQALDLLELAPGQSLLVTGAAGALGGFAVQLAARRGVAVTAPARAGDEEFIRSLGAVDFVSGEVGAARFDAVLDAAVLGEPALEWVRDGGAYMGVIPEAHPASVRGVRTASVGVRADGARLAELVGLVDEGALTLRVAGTYPLDEASKAHARLAEGGVRGRLVLVP